MKSLITFNHIEVENANAIAGMTWGFPAISNFLGFTHAISRKLSAYSDLTLGSCAVICHSHQVHAYQPTSLSDFVFSLTRNPLTKKGVSPSFVEEGRMHMDISLVIECNFKHSQLDFDLEDDSDEAQAQHLIDWIYQQAIRLRLAGGAISAIQKIEFDPVPTNENELAKFERRKLMRLLPGYLLVDRNDLLREYHSSRLIEDAKATLLDSWLDFISIKYKAESTDTLNDVEVVDMQQSKVKWDLVPKPASGWLVPITTGFTAISPLYEPGEVLRTRDDSTPFQFVESVYSIGQWISPHRVKDLSGMFWRYKKEGDDYLCVNNFLQ